MIPIAWKVLLSSLLLLDLCKPIVSNNCDKMSLLRSMLDWDLGIPSIYDQDFGLGLLDDDLIVPSTSRVLQQYHPRYFRPWRYQPALKSGVSQKSDNSDEFKVNLDVQQFKPEQINVKVVDNYVVIDGKHEERRDDHGFVSRQFQRRYLLPENVDPNTVQSTLSSDGVLTIAAAKTKPLPANERAVPIVQTQQPAIKLDAEKKEKTEGADKMES